jgi:hypothetical protein
MARSRAPCRNKPDGRSLCEQGRSVWRTATLQDEVDCLGSQNRWTFPKIGVPEGFEACGGGADGCLWLVGLGTLRGSGWRHRSEISGCRSKGEQVA